MLRPNASRRDAAEPGRVESPGEARPLADRLLEGGWLSLVLLVPLVMNPWGQSIFSLPKAIALRAVVMALIAVWGAHKLLVGRSMRLRSGRTVLALPAVGLIVAISLATIFARAPALSLWGSHGRSEGALTLVCLPILALLVSARLPGVDGARRIFVAASATVLPLTAYASLQLWGPDPLGIVTDARSPIFATLGRSNFLGSYLAMLIPLSLTLVALAKRPALKVAAVALGALELILLIATQARAGWLAAFVGVSCWAGLLFRDRIKALAQSTTARAVTVTASAVIAAVALWLAQTGATGAGRLAIWQGTLRLIVARPLLGYGPDSLGLVFPRVYPPELVYYQGRGFVVDRAHNLVLDWTVTLGTLGLFMATAFLFVVLRAGCHALQRSGDDSPRMLLVVGAVAALVGNIAGHFASFDTLSTQVLTSVLAGVVVALDRRNESSLSPHQTVPPPSARGPLVLLAVVSICLLAVGGIWALSVRPLKADVQARRAERLAQAGQWDAAVSPAARSVESFPPEPRYLQQLGWIHLQRALHGSSDPEALAAAQRALESAVAMRPDDYLLVTALAEFHAAAALQFDRRHFGPSEDAWTRATALAPNHGLLYLAWGKTRLQAGKPVEAMPLLRKAVDLDSTDAEAWLILGQLELSNNRPTEALVHFRQAATYQPDRPEPLVGLARVYWLLGQPEAAREALQAALVLDPDNAAAQTALTEFSAD